MNVTDKICDLACVKEGNVHEFVGPVKIILVDPPEDQYARRKSGGACVTLAVLMIGANTFCMLLFCFGFKLPIFINSHILLCTIGSQFCMPLGILMINSLFGAAAPMKKNQRRTQHLFIQLLSLALTGAGAGLAIAMGEKSVIDPPKPFTSLHFIFGCASGGFIVLSLLMGPMAYCLKKERTSPSFITKTHRIFGVFAMLLSTVCFIFGIMKPTMMLWLYILGYLAPAYMVIFFAVFYTLVVITTPLGRFCEKTKKSV